MSSFKRAYFIDVQGTLIDDAKKLPIAGSREFIGHLNAQKIPYMVITNNTKHNSESFLNYLNNVGLHVSKDHYLDPLMLLQSKIPQGTALAAYGTKEFLDQLCTMGYVLEYEKPDIVLVSIKHDYTFEECAQMIGFLLSGAELIGMHETSLYAKHGKISWRWCYFKDACLCNFSEL